MNPASTTKIMTCLIALEDPEIHMDDLWTAGPEIVVSEPGASMGGFQQGDQLNSGAGALLSHGAIRRGCREYGRNTRRGQRRGFR